MPLRRNVVACRAPSSRNPRMIGGDILFFDLADTPTLVDRSGKGNTATINGTTLISGVGRTFNGTNSDYIDISHASVVESASVNGPVSLFMYIRAPAVNFSNPYLIAKGSGSGADTQLGIKGVGGVAPQAANGVVGGTGVNATGWWNINTWYHIGMVWNGSTITFYVNAEVKGTPASKSGPVATKSPFRIGQRNGSLYFPGDIGEVWISSQALTTDQILAHFNATKARYGL